VRNGGDPAIRLAAFQCPGTPALGNSARQRSARPGLPPSRAAACHRAANPACRRPEPRHAPACRRPEPPHAITLQPAAPPPRAPTRHRPTRNPAPTLPHPDLPPFRYWRLANATR